MSQDNDYVPELKDYVGDEEEENPIKVPTEVNEEFDMSDLGEEVAPVSKIEESVFSWVDPGKHILRIKQVVFDFNGKTGRIKAYVSKPDGSVSPILMFCKTVIVTFCDLENPNRTVRDRFVMPPADKAERVGYMHGFKDESKALENNIDSLGCGFHARKLKQFVSRVGFQADEQGRIDPRGFNPANWVDRVVGLEVERKAQDYKKDGKMIHKTAEEAWPNVKILSYFHVVKKSSPVTPVASDPIQPAPETTSKPLAGKQKKVAQKA